jgi:hypothetical protein
MVVALTMVKETRFHEAVIFITNFLANHCPEYNRQGEENV